jgi:hypothetical protein
MRTGTARYSRECLACGELILAGDKVVCQGANESYEWVHQDCFRPDSPVVREAQRLDREFRQITGPAFTWSAK